MSLAQIKRFDSVRWPGRFVYYLRLNDSARHTLQFCYGAGGTCLNMNQYQAFLDTHPDLSLLCIDRYCQGLPSSKEVNLGELSDITCELHQYLKIDRLSIAAHSAGIYQALDLAQRHHEYIDFVFPLCSHIPAQLTGSRAMTGMTRLPNAVLQFIGKVDTMPLPDLLGAALGHPRPGDSHLVLTAETKLLLNTHGLDVGQLRLQSQRRKLDYAFCYEHMANYTGKDLLALYTACPIPIIWLTTIKDVFFGPTSAQRVLAHKARCDSTIVRFDQASHIDIYLRLDVWNFLYDKVCENVQARYVS